MVSGPNLTLEVSGRVATLTLRRPEIRNAISGKAMLDELVGALTHAGSDPAVSVLVLTGAGSAFSAGGDVKDMRDGTGLFATGSPDAISEMYRSGIQRLPRILNSLDIVTIAAVNGPAIGAGCDLALMCDLRYASTDAFFGETFINLGLISGDGGTWFLPRIVGWQRAAELLLTGRLVDAQEAKRLGVVLEVVEPDRLIARVREIAELIASKPPHAIRLTKRLLHQVMGEGLDGFLDLSASYQAACHQTEDHATAVRGFFDKRPGVYENR